MSIEVGDYIWVSGWGHLSKVKKITLGKVYFSDTHWINIEALYTWINEKHARVFTLKEEQ